MRELTVQVTSSLALAKAIVLAESEESGSVIHSREVLDMMERAPVRTLALSPVFDHGSCNFGLMMSSWLVER